MPGSIRIGRIFGVPVGVHWSLLGIAALLTLNLANGNLPMAHPGHDGWLYWVVAAATTVAFLGAVLAHEIGHAVVARRYGVGVEGIDLWILGGMARLSDESPTPRAEWRIAAAGPLVSVFVTLAFAGAAAIVTVFDQPGLVASAFWWLAFVNGLLALFNVLPAAPLDGGRMLTATLWRRGGSRLRAAERASQAGQLLGLVLVGWGLYGFLSDRGPNLITVLLGWFLITAARQDYLAARARAALAGLSVADVAWFGIARAGGDIDALTMLWERGRMGDVGLVAVERPDGSVLGLVSEDRLWRVPEGAMATTSLASLAAPIERFARAAADEPLVRALNRLPSSHPTLTVWDGNRLVGVVRWQTVERCLAEREPQLDAVATR
jgi:Zn-dependent protease